MASTHHVGFRHFSDNLYCSGAQERLCALPHQSARTQPGECMWFTANGKAVTHEDMAESQRARWAADRWDASAAGAISTESFRKFDRAATAQCVRERHVLVLGESTTRDLFLEFTAHAGLKPPPGPCMNTGGKSGPICTRVVTGGVDNSTRLSFQFLSSANSSREIEVTKRLVAERAPDAVFAYCFMYDWYGLNPGGLWQGESNAMGEACLQLLSEAIRAAQPHVPIYLLGPGEDWRGARTRGDARVETTRVPSGSRLRLRTLALALPPQPQPLAPTLVARAVFPPMWVSPYENRTRDDSAMARIFRSIHGGLGIQCVRGAGGASGDGGTGGGAGGGGDYRVVSSKGLRGPIDRYNIVGHRKRDRIHPYPNAHAPVVQMMLNWMCAAHPSG